MKRLMLIFMLFFIVLINVNADVPNVPDNNYLRLLEVEGYTIKFDKNVTDYYIDLEESDGLVIKAIPEDPSAIVQINNNYNLRKGSKIRIIVTSQVNTQRIYTINIGKNKSNFLLYTLFILIIVSLIVLFYFIINGFNPDKEIVIESIEVKKRDNRVIFEKE